MKKLYLLLFVPLSLQISAQEFYITSFDYFSELNTIKHVDSNLNVTPLSSIFVNGEQILDIAYSSAGKLFGVTPSVIVEINLTNGSSDVVYTFPNPAQFNSLVCNSNNEILALDFYNMNLITINLTTFTEVSNVVINDQTPGDLTFYKGNLIFQSELSHNILSYDENGLKTVACGMNYNTGEAIQFWGLSNYTDSCGNNFVYGFDQFGYVYLYNIEAKTNEIVGHLTEDDYNPINGSTTINEYLASACPKLVLETVDCVLKVENLSLFDLKFYPNPVENILHIEKLNKQEKLNFVLFSVEGKKLMDGILNPELDLSKLVKGIYYMKIYDKVSAKTITKKVIKK